jgi:hypothetical protein
VPKWIRVPRLGVIAGAAPAVFATLVGCGASDRGLLFGDDTPSTLTPPTQGGAGGATAPGGGGMPAYGGNGSGADPIHIDPMPTDTPPPPPLNTGGVPMFSSGGSAGIMHSPDAGMAPLDSSSQLPIEKCNFDGTWGTIIRVPVTWPDSPLILHGGTGTVVQWNISHRDRDTQTSYHEATSVCGIALPDLSGAALVNNEKFGIRFPTSIFDQGGIPPVVFSTIAKLVGTVEQWNAGPVALLTGLIMTDPSTAPWPTTFTDRETPDQDMDGAPGVTVTAVDPMTDSAYNLPPVGLPPYPGADYPRADRISVVVRTVTNLRGTAVSCDELRAAVDIITIDDKPALNSMVIGCTKVDKTQMPPAEVICSAAEAQFVNAQRPVFTPSGPGTLVSIRLPDNAGCPEVRRNLPQ